MGLFKPVWQSNNKEKALKIVEMENNQKKLVRILRNATLFCVRAAAAEKLVDRSVAQEVFVDIAMRSNNEEERIEAVNMLTDQSRLADIVKIVTNTNVCEKAIKRITDQSILAEIATNKDYNTAVRKSATYRLTDQSVLGDIAKDNDCDIHVRKEAIYRLTDQSVLAEIVKNDNNDLDLRIQTIRFNLTDQSVLAEVAQNHNTSSLLRSWAISHLTDQSVLSYLAVNESEYEVRFSAIRILKDKNLMQQLCVNIVLNDNVGIGNRIKAYEILLEQGDTYVLPPTVQERFDKLYIGEVYKNYNPN